MINLLVCSTHGEYRVSARYLLLRSFLETITSVNAMVSFSFKKLNFLAANCEVSMFSRDMCPHLGFRNFPECASSIQDTSHIISSSPRLRG